MSFNPSRNIASVAIFWLFVGFCAAAFALGWGLDHAPIDPAARENLSDLHISLGLSAALLLLAQFLLGAALYIYRGGGGEPTSRREIAGFWLRQLVFLAFIAAAGATRSPWLFAESRCHFGDIRCRCGICRTAHSPSRYKGPMPTRLTFSPPPFWLMRPLRYSTCCSRRGRATPARWSLLFQPPRPGSSPKAWRAVSAFSAAQPSGSSFFSASSPAVLLGFGFAGRTISPGGTVFGDAIFWAAGALGILVPTTLFAFKYMKTARRIRNDPARYLSRAHRSAFWFIVGVLLSVLGLLDSFVGVGLSVALLVGKTMSQPPGIAITDPTKIIRALDIFVLLVNFSLLFAHFVGFGVAAWLRISSLQARHQYLLAPFAVKQPPSAANEP